MESRELLSIALLVLSAMCSSLPRHYVETSPQRLNSALVSLSLVLLRNSTLQLQFVDLHTLSQ